MILAEISKSLPFQTDISAINLLKIRLNGSVKGKGVGAGRGDYCSFAMVVGMERFGATGGASPLPYEKRV